MKDSTRIRPRDWLLLVVLMAVGVALGRVQNAARSRGEADGLTSLIQTFVDAPASAVRTAVEGVDDFWQGLVRAPSLTRENRELRAKLAAAELYQENLDALQGKISRLYRMLDLPETAGRKRVVGRVTAYWPHENRLTVSVGKRQGVRTNLAVVNQDGLVGVVQTVEEDRCQVLLVTSPSQTVGAVALRDPPQPGLLKGQTPTRLLLEFVDTQSPLEIGDKVVTSGKSETIPGGIPIGRIIKIEHDADFGSRRAQVFPNVKVGEVTEVYIVL